MPILFSETQCIFILDLFVYSDDGKEVYAPIRNFVLRDLWAHLPDSFLESAVVNCHKKHEELCTAYAHTFIVGPCHRKHDFRSSSSIVNSLHAQLPVPIFVAMELCGIVNKLEGRPLQDSFFDSMFQYSD